MPARELVPGTVRRSLYVASLSSYNWSRYGGSTGTWSSSGSEVSTAW